MLYLVWARQHVSEYRGAALSISVVIPAYNASEFLAATIASVRSQTVIVDEIIVVDDGSSDNTVDVARLSGARVIEQRNCGVSAARNRGIELARSPWIALLDADDLWQPDKLECQWFAIQSQPDISFVFCDFSQFDERGVRNASVLHEVHQQFARTKLTALGKKAFLCDPSTLRDALLVQNVIQPSALLIRKETVQALGGFDMRLLACQDYDFVMRLTRDHVGGFVDRPLVRYRRHATATTSNIPKSREGLANVALRAIVRPFEYSPETVEHFRHVLPQLFLKCGFAHLRYGDPHRAREWLVRSICERFNVPAAILYAATFVVQTRAGRTARKFALRFASRAR